MILMDGHRVRISSGNLFKFSSSPSPPGAPPSPWPEWGPVRRQTRTARPRPRWAPPTPPGDNNNRNNVQKQGCRKGASPTSVTYSDPSGTRRPRAKRRLRKRRGGGGARRSRKRRPNTSRDTSR